MSTQSPQSFGRLERVLAYMVAGVVGLSILAFLTVLIATASGVRDFDEGLWPTIFVLPLVGLPIGFVLIVVLMILTAVKRGRGARGSDRARR